MAHGCHCANSRGEAVNKTPGGSTDHVDAYLKRLGVERPDATDVDSLARLTFAHLVAVPFENREIFDGRPPAVSIGDMLDKIVENGQGGWCFETNGAFGWLLDQLGFTVRYLGAAVLLNGPATVIDHLTLEVQLERPYLVDVGFGDSFHRPLDLSRGREQDGGAGSFVFVPSPQGTTLARLVDGVPEAQYRFRRVTHRLEEFAPIAHRMAADRESRWRQQPFATRLLGTGDDRVTLTADRLTIRRCGERVETQLGDGEWLERWSDWFGSGNQPAGSLPVGVDDGQ
jgi:N-hydroxyarylamine O-acetyltransferase